MKKIFTIILISILILVILGCIKNTQPNNEHLSVIAPTSEMKLMPSNNLVENFLSKNGVFNSGYEADDCFNITPDFIANNSTFTIFKHNS